MLPCPWLLTRTPRLTVSFKLPLQRWTLGDLAPRASRRFGRRFAPELRWRPPFRTLSRTNWILKNWASSRDVTGSALQVFRTQARVLGHLRQGDRSQLLFVVLGKTELGPPLTPQRPMGTGGADNTPPNALQRRQRPPRLGCGPLAHAAMENCSVSAAGFISPCSISSAITRRARDLAFSVASSGVAPYTVTPGSSGMSAIQRPSVSRSNRIVSCICLILPFAALDHALRRLLHAHHQTLSKHVQCFLDPRQFGGVPGIQHPPHLLLVA